MKKVFLMIVCAASVLVGQAQVKLGVKSGFNFANMVGPDINNNSTKLSFHVGGFANIPLIDNFTIQPELVFSRQGARLKAPNNYVSRVRLNYLNIPILTQYNDPTGFYAETGPQFGFLINAKEKYNGNVNGVNGSYKSFDLSWGFGAGYRFTDQASVGLRWNLGVTDVSEYPGTVRNSVLQLGVAYSLATSK